MITKYGIEIDGEIVVKRMDGLVNQFFKILPLRENNEKTLERYMSSLLREMLGYRELIDALGKDDLYLMLLGILEGLIQSNDDVAVVRSDVFRAISILKTLRDRYAKGVSV